MSTDSSAAARERIERCKDLRARAIQSQRELERHLVTDEVGDTYPADTPGARAAFDADVTAFDAWEAECWTDQPGQPAAGGAAAGEETR
jgi:hypothetical protein